MNERLTPDAQRHLQVLQRYMLAMENGDIDSIAIVLHEAEQDRALENMLLEVNDFYQQEDHTIAEVTDVTQASLSDATVSADAVDVKANNQNRIVAATGGLAFTKVNGRSPASLANRPESAGPA